MTAPVVTFDFTAFTAGYPEFSNLSSDQGQAFFDRGGLYFANSAFNPAFVNGVPYMTQLAYLMTAHLAWLYAPRDASGNPSATGTIAPQTVGQITNASQGSVSVGLKPVTEGSAEWFAQTKYGLSYWQATAQFRTMQYVVNPLPRGAASAIFPYGGFFGLRRR